VYALYAGNRCVFAAICRREFSISSRKARAISGLRAKYQSKASLILRFGADAQTLAFHRASRARNGSITSSTERSTPIPASASATRLSASAFQEASTSASLEPSPACNNSAMSQFKSSAGSRRTSSRSGQQCEPWEDCSAIVIERGFDDAQFRPLHHLGDSLAGFRRYCSKVKTFVPDGKNHELHLRLKKKLDSY
jgi:hypothetical protein